MRNFFITKPEGILLLRPAAPLSKEDFEGLSADVDACLAEHPRLYSAMIHAKGFPDWENFGSFMAPMHFVREHHRQIERIAVVRDSQLAGMPEQLGQAFHLG